MEKIVKQFLIENQDLLKENKLKEFYNSSFKSLSRRDEVSQLTQFFIENGINPLLYMDEVPMDYAYGLKNIQINIPSNIRFIDEFSFSHFKNDSLFIPEGVTRIENSSFIYSEINKIHFPKSLTHISKECFEESNIKEIEYVGSMEEWIRLIELNYGLEDMDLIDTLNYLGILNPLDVKLKFWG